MITLSDIYKKAQINAGSFIISIGTHKDTEVSLISKSSGKFVTFESIKKSKKLKSVKSKFKPWLNSDETFTFSHMMPERTIELIEFLRK